MSNLPYTIHNGNSLEVLKTLDENSIDSIVCDPPYELGFMNKKWDSSGIAYNVELWKECLRVLKPGGHLLAFSGSRTYHRMAVAIEDAGFEVRNQLMWVFGSGFPKSHDISKAIDKMAGAERKVMGVVKRSKSDLTGANGLMKQNKQDHLHYITAPATEEAKKWQGWGTSLKPAHEPICLARKPFDVTVAENVLLHGTGAINIDGCRVGTDELTYTSTFKRMIENNINSGYRPETMRGSGGDVTKTVKGRFPSNFIHDGSDEVISLFPESKGMSGCGIRKKESDIMPSIQVKGESDNEHLHRNDEGSAARFFYCAKASKRDRDEGLDGFEEIASSSMPGRRNSDDASWNTGNDVTDRFVTIRKNFHPTVKPTTLMQYLCRLITPPNGIVLDPFMGSGSTGKAAMYEGFRFIGIDLDSEYCQIAEARIEFAIQDKDRPNKKEKEKGKRKKQKVVEQSDTTTKSLW